MKLRSKILIGFFVFIVVLVGFVFWAINSSFLTEKVLLALAGSKLKNVKIEKLEIKRQQAHLPTAISFYQIQAQLNSKDVLYKIDIQDIKIEDIKEFVLSKGNLKVAVKGLKVQSNKLNVHNLNLLVRLIKESSQMHLAGFWSASYLDFGEYQLTLVESKIEGIYPHIELNDLTGNFYDGKFRGKVVFDLQQVPTYNVGLALSEVNVAQMQNVNKAVFSKMKGKVHGTVAIDGEGDKVEKVEANFFTPAGSELKASLLSPLLNYIPQSTQRKDLETIINLDGDIPLEVAQVDLKKVEEQKIATKITLKSRKINLDINLTIDITFDTNLKNLLNQLHRFNFQ